MQKRLSFEATRIGAKFITAGKGHGSTGQIKKAGFWGRSVTVQGEKLNAGSLIDFLNTQVSSDKQLKKGCFLGLGGTCNKEISALFDELYPIDADYRDKVRDIKKSFVSMQANADILINEDLMDNPITLSAFFRLLYANQVVLLTKGYDPDTSEKFEGIFIDKRGITPVLHICLPDSNLSHSLEDNVNNILSPLFEEAIESMAELNLPLPDFFCCDYNPIMQMDVVGLWQSKNRILK